MARFSSPVVFLLVVVLAVALKGANGDAVTNKKIDEAMAAIVGDCIKEHGINVEEAIKVSQKNNNLDNIDPCFFQCLFKKVGSFDDKGNLNKDSLIAFAKEVLNNEGDAEKIDAIGSACLKDTNYDCEKSKELIFCLLEQKDKVSL